MDEQFVTLTNDCSDYVYVEAKDIKSVSGGMKPNAENIKWYNPPSKYPEYYNEYHEYDRMDLTDGSSNNDEVLSDGKYNPGFRYVMYSRLKPTTLKVRPTQIKESLSKVYASTKLGIIPESILRQLLAKEVGLQLNNTECTNLVCVIEDINDLIVLEDLFGVSDAIDPVEHDILKNEIKLYIFDPKIIYNASEEKKYKEYMEIKNRIEKGFYKKKIEFLDMLRWNKNLEPKERTMFLRCGVYPQEGEEPERTYDRVKGKLEEIYREFERYKDDYEGFKINIFRKIQKCVLPERNEWDRRYNDEAITELLVQGIVKYFSALYISKDNEQKICMSLDERRRFRYGRVYNVDTLGVFDSSCLALDKIIDIEELKLKNIDSKKKEQVQQYPIIR